MPERLLLGEDRELVAEAGPEGLLDLRLHQVDVRRRRCALTMIEDRSLRAEQPLRGGRGHVDLVVLVAGERAALLGELSDDREPLAVDGQLAADGVLAREELARPASRPSISTRAAVAYSLRL